MDLNKYKIKIVTIANNEIKKADTFTPTQLNRINDSILAIEGLK